MPWWQIILNGPFLLAGFVIKAGFFFLKGFGKTYIDGLREGMILCKAKGKPKLTKGLNLRDVKIQLELWLNLAQMKR
jgi:hypothetical protein